MYTFAEVVAVSNWQTRVPLVGSLSVSKKQVKVCPCLGCILLWSFTFRVTCIGPLALVSFFLPGACVFLSMFTFICIVFCIYVF